MVEGQLDRNGIGVPIGGRDVVEEHGVDVLALGEPTAVLVEPVHLLAGPLPVLRVLPSVDPVDGDVGARIDGIRDFSAAIRDSQVLERPGRDPATSGEEPRTDHTARIEVVALVPPVVGDLVAPLGIDEGEQHAPDLDGLVVHGLRLLSPPVLSGVDQRNNQGRRARSHEARLHAPYSSLKEIQSR